MSAKVHTQTSNRAQQKNKRKDRTKEEDAGRKVVFKSVLDNPLVVKWPPVPLNVQNNVLAALTRILDATGIAAYHEAREKLHRHKKAKVKKASVRAGAKDSDVVHSGGSNKKRKAPLDLDSEDDESFAKRRRVEEPSPQVNETSSIEIDSSPPALPASVSPSTPALAHIIFGLNAITKRLELLSSPSPSSTPSPSSPTTPSPIRFIFACTSDVDPPGLLEHLPILVATANASRSPTSGQKDVLLIPLPKNAEGVLTEAVELRRTAVLALDDAFPGLEALDQFIPSIPVLSAPWLVPPLPPRSSTSPHPSAHAPNNGTSRLIATKVKQVQTSAPSDMKKAKERRVRERGEAKARVREAKVASKGDSKGTGNRIPRK